MIGHLNGTGNKLGGRDDTASKGNRDQGSGKAGKRPKKKRIKASKVIAKIKGLTKAKAKG